MAGHGAAGPAGSLRISPSDVGRRVSVRRVLEEREGRPVYGDVIGTLTSWDGGVLVVEDRGGAAVRIPEDVVVAGKPVPPPPVRRGRAAVAAHRAVDAAELQWIAGRGWPALEAEPLGGWLLRATGGFTRRANSALAGGDPGLPAGEALERVRAWYAARGLPPYVQVTDADAPLVAELEARGWRPEAGAEMRTAPLATVLAATGPAAAEVRLSRRPGPGWLERYHRVPPGGGSALEVLCGGPSVWFAEIAGEGEPAAIGRCVVDGRWAGFAAVEVAPERRREGLATAVMGALAARAVAERAELAYLQVEVENTAALKLYAGMGFETHHGYHYRRG